MGHWKQLSGSAVTITSTGLASAPNVTLTGVAITLLTSSHLTIPLFSATINFPSSLGTLAIIEVYAKDPATGEEIQVGRYDSGFTPSGTLGIACSHPKIVQTAANQVGWELSAVCYNAEYKRTASPATVTGLTITGYGITVLSGVDHTAARWDDGNRSVYAPQTVTIKFGTYPSPMFSLWGYDGSINKIYGWYQIGQDSVFDIGGPNGKEAIFAPTADVTYTLRAAPGAWYGNHTDGWTCPDLGVTVPITNIALIPNIVNATPYTLHKMGLPLSTNITAVTVDTGIGGTWPYDETDGSGFHDWCITSISVDPTNTRNDPNSFTIIMTCQDLDFTGAVIGVEHVYGTPQVAAAGTSQIMGQLNGPYGNVANPPRSGNIGKVRLRFYCGNRLNQTTEAWQDNTATTLQNVNGVGYKDVVVSTNGTTPSGAVTGSRTASANRALVTSRVASSSKADSTPWAGVTGPIDTGGGGSAQAIQQIKDASGNVVAWFGKKTVGGVDYYGIWGANVWIGGTDPSAPKAWLDNTGNLRMVGYLQGGGIDIQTGLYEAKLDGTTAGLLVFTIGSVGVYCLITSSAVTLTDGTTLSGYTNTGLNLANGKLVSDGNGKITKYNGATLANLGLAHPIFYSEQYALTTSQTITVTYNGGTPPAGIYRIWLDMKVWTYGTGGAIVPTFTANRPWGGTEGGFRGVGGASGIFVDCIATDAEGSPTYFPEIVNSDGTGMTFQTFVVQPCTGGASYYYQLFVERLK